jgi:Skp family chaperone for outer membrane proteins
MQSNRLHRVALSLSILLVAAASATAQGVVLKTKAVVMYGEASNCSKPAAIDVAKVAEKTPEWKEIKSQGLAEDSARYKLLMSAMLKRIKEACKEVAEDQGHDLVVRQGDIQNARGMTEADVTDKVIAIVEKGTP